MQSDYHRAVTLREIVFLDINAHWGFDNFINRSQIMKNVTWVFISY